MTSLPNFWRIMQLQQQWRKLHPHQLPCDIDTQALKQPERSSGLVSAPISGSPHQYIIGTEKAQPLLGSDNVVRVTPERGDWRSQAPANATSAEDGEFAALQPAPRLDEGLSSSFAAGEAARSPEASPSAEGRGRRVRRRGFSSPSTGTAASGSARAMAGGSAAGSRPAGAASAATLGARGLRGARGALGAASGAAAGAAATGACTTGSTTGTTGSGVATAISTF